jgi:hypothetical protein
MYTVIETDVFQRAAAPVWTEVERVAFINWLAANPLAGGVISGSGGCRKVRWARNGMGKRGGARVIYFNRLDHGEVAVDGVRQSQIRQLAHIFLEPTARGDQSWIRKWNNSRRTC